MIDKTKYNSLKVQRVLLRYSIKKAQKKHRPVAHLQERLQRITHTMLAMEVKA